MNEEMLPFLAWSVEITLYLLLLSIGIALLRLVRGPTLPDRIVALDLVTLVCVAVIALFSIRLARPVFLDAAIALALVAFLGTVAYARFLERRAQQAARSDDV
jgi:multicomponent Na+:H+ antiporter subunit F